MVDRGSGYGWHRSPDCTGSEERRSHAAGDLGRNGPVSEEDTESKCFLAAAHGVVYEAHFVCNYTHLLLRVGAVALAVLVVLRLTVGRRRRVLLLLVVAAIPLLLLMCAIVAVALAAVEIVVGHCGCVVLWIGCRCSQVGRAQLLMSVAGEGRQGHADGWVGV